MLMITKKTNESYSLDAPGMQVWWHGTTESEFGEIYAPSFKNPFFISDDPVEASMYMDGDYGFDSSKSKLVLVVLNPKSLKTFDWHDPSDLNLIPSIPRAINEWLL